MTVASRFAWRWPGWDRFLLWWCAGFHGLIAFTLTLAPADQIINAGTRPAFDLASRYFWAGWFAVAAVATVVLLYRRTTLVQLLTWFTVLPLGGAWWTAFVLAVINGHGSAIGVVVWVALYVPWAISGLRLALGKR